LLLNPSFKRKILTNVKPNLIVAIDNSESVRFLNKEKKVREFLNELEKSNLSKKFNVDIYSLEQV
jgi:polynucleotide 5'-kinase involved in rRNA processing